MVVATLALCLVFLLSSGKTAPTEGREYCETETFEAACDSDEVVVIEEALYGRMQLGRCVKTDYGYIGCTADVLAIMDEICSGKQTCSVDVPNRMLDETRPCPAEFTVYLWVKYSCVKGTADYCPNETFEANCEQPDEVIVMQRARYGRMQIGRCIQADFGTVGCAVNVLPFADMRCSGKRTCAIQVPNHYLDEINTPCIKELKMYLEAAYTCISVIRPQLAKCEDRGPVDVEGTTGILSSAITRETGCGSATTPWVIRADPGQQISFRLTDFGLLGRNQTLGSGQVPQHCQVYAVIKEGRAGRESTICGGHSSQSRERHVYMSMQNYVEVRIVVGKNTDAADFHLSFEATGCPDKRPPVNGWVQRQGTEVKVGCFGSTQSLTMNCTNGSWVGYMPSCVGKTATGSEGREYCETETFEAACDSDEVVVIEEAWYGRMQLGRCVKTDYGHIGCKADVLAIMDEICSGKQTCSVDVPNRMLDETRPCPAEFKVHLWAKYSCVKVVRPDSGVCNQPLVVTGPEGYLANVVTSETNCGTAKNPYVIEVALHETVKLILMDFFSDTEKTEPFVCNAYAAIVEKSGIQTTICGGGQRVRQVYASAGNRVKIRMFEATYSGQKGRFLLKFESTGPPQIDVFSASLPQQLNCAWFAFWFSFELVLYFGL